MIEIDSGVWAALTLGFLLGLKHATDADHVVAVSVIASEQRNPWQGLWVGASWGLGHTTPLLILGLVILALKETVLDRYETISPILEFGVGLMLVLLGIQVFWNLRKGALHTHSHVHGGQSHVHIHSDHGGDQEPIFPALHKGFWRFGKPAFRMKSYTVGLVHGLAGSAAVMLVLLPQIESIALGIGYLVLFGIGTIISMGILTIGLGIPFALTQRARDLNRAVAGIAGLASVAVGAVLMSDIALGTHLLPY